MTAERTRTLRPVPLDPELDHRPPPFQVEAMLNESPIATERRRRQQWHLSQRAVEPPSADEVRLGEVRCRVHGADSSHRAVIMWLHGGGWLFGEPEGDEQMLAEISRRTGLKVVAVDYRLAPEHPYPAALQDVVAVYRELVSSGSRVLVAGASAGATLAAAVCLALRDHSEEPPIAQLLICPPLDNKARDDDDGPLRRHNMDEFWDAYLHHDSTDPHAVPERASSLSGLPAAYVFTTSSDPLRLEGWHYANRLVEDGVEVTARFLPGGYHGFEYEAPETAFTKRAVNEWIGAIRTLTSSHDIHQQGSSS